MNDFRSLQHAVTVKIWDVTGPLCATAAPRRRRSGRGCTEGAWPRYGRQLPARRRARRRSPCPASARRRATSTRPAGTVAAVSVEDP